MRPGPGRELEAPPSSLGGAAPEQKEPACSRTGMGLTLAHGASHWISEHLGRWVQRCSARWWGRVAVPPPLSMQAAAWTLSCQDALSVIAPSVPGHVGTWLCLQYA